MLNLKKITYFAQATISIINKGNYPIPLPTIEIITYIVLTTSDMPKTVP